LSFLRYSSSKASKAVKWPRFSRYFPCTARLSGLLCVSVFLAAAAQSGLQVRLESHLTSYSTPAGTPFECVVLRSFQAAPDTLIPRGTRIYGRVGKAQSVGIGFRHERALLELVFDRYKTPDGDVFPLQAELLSIDNAREDVLAHGRIRGVAATAPAGAGDAPSAPATAVR